MPIYYCKNCGFTFKREGKPEQCPDCGKPEIRAALKAEIVEFERRYVEEHQKLQDV